MGTFKIRASACHFIMGEKGIGKTGESFLQNWYKESLYGRKKEFSNKYTQKGIECENNSIETVIKMLNLDITTVKNEIFAENNYITGTCDIIQDDYIIDVKNSFDPFTFPLFEKEVPNKDYYWQAQCYMDLYNKEQYKLIYTLNNTPIDIIESEARKYCFQNGIDTDDYDVLKKFISSMSYDDIDISLKYKCFDIKRNESDINKIKERVKISRDYLETIKIN